MDIVLCCSVILSPRELDTQTNKYNILKIYTFFEIQGMQVVVILYDENFEHPKLKSWV